MILYPTIQCIQTLHVPSSKSTNHSTLAADLSDAPSASSVLVLSALVQYRPERFQCGMATITEADVAWASPTLDRIEISLQGSNSFIQSGTRAQMLATAYYRDHTDYSPVGVQWSIQSNALGVTIGSSTGIVSSPILAYDTDLVVTATLVDPIHNDTVTNTYVPCIIATVVDAIIGIEIEGQESYSFI